MKDILIKLEHFEMIKGCLYISQDSSTFQVPLSEALNPCVFQRSYSVTVLFIVLGNSQLGIFRV